MAELKVTGTDKGNALGIDEHMPTTAINSAEKNLEWAGGTAKSFSATHCIKCGVSVII